jgi:hypothetical protein
MATAAGKQSVEEDNLNRPLTISMMEHHHAFFMSIMKDFVLWPSLPNFGS